MFTPGRAGRAMPAGQARRSAAESRRPPLRHRHRNLIPLHIPPHASDCGDVKSLYNSGYEMATHADQHISVSAGWAAGAGGTSAGGRA